MEHTERTLRIYADGHTKDKKCLHNTGSVKTSRVASRTDLDQWIDNQVHAKMHKLAMLKH